jgi:hypothetical protein
MLIMNGIEMQNLATKLRRIVNILDDDDPATRIASQHAVATIAARLDEAGLAKRERTLMRRAATRRRNARAAEATQEQPA